MMNGYQKISALCFVGALNAFAVAQVARAESEETLETITITASKMDESIDKASLAVTALTSADLSRAGIVNVLDLSTFAPNFNIGVNGVTNGLDISIRGITTQNDDYAGNPAIATSVDGVYVARTQGLNQGLYDLERVEILRGPQGTLYGRNATGGAVNIITAQPKFDAIHASGDVSYGNYNSVVGHGMVNLPISSTFAIRVAGGYDRNSGYVDTHYPVSAFASPTGPVGPNTGNYNRTDAWSARISALWTPSDKLAVHLSASETVNDGSPPLPVATPLGIQTYQYLIGGVLTPVQTSNLTSPFDRVVNSGGISDTRVWDARGRIDYRFNDAFSTTYTGGVGGLRTHRLLDPDGSDVNNGLVEGRDTERSSYHEVNLRYDSSVLKALVGGDYADEHISGNFNITNFGPELFPNGAPQSPGGLQLPHPNNVLSSYGFFSQATYSVLPELRVTGGVRYSHDFQAFREGEGIVFCQQFTPLNDFSTCNPIWTPADGQSNFGNFGSNPGQFSIPNTESSTFHNTSWKAGLEYDLNAKTLLYGTVSTGYKAGGPANSPFAKPFQPETVRNFEIGAKTSPMDNLKLRTAAFYMKYRDYQVSQDSAQAYLPSGIPGFPIAVTNLTTVNAADAKIYGLELESNWLVTSNDRVDFSGSYLHANFGKFVSAEDLVTQPGNPAQGILPPTVNWSGNRLIRSPRVSGRVSYEHRIPLANGSVLTADLSAYAQSMIYLREANAPIDRQGGYALLDASLGYTFSSGKVRVEAFGKNLANRYYRVGEFLAVFSVDSFYGDPRLYGLRISASY